MWEIAAADQGLTLLYALCWGAGMGAFYDVFRAVRRCGAGGVGVTAVLDFVFWLCCAFATFFLLLARENGEIRIYVLAGELAGALLFRLTVSRLLFEPLVAVLRIFRRGLCFCGKIWGNICGIIRRFLSGIKKSLKKCPLRQKNA